jgi:2-phosphoglycerate kinase
MYHMQHKHEALRRELKQIYWIGGSPCSGKSSIAAGLAAAYGLRVYHCDDAYFRHAKIINQQEQPVFYKLTRCTSEELWLKRPVKQQVQEEIELYREEFPLILDELLTLPKPFLAEGAALLPECVAPIVQHNPRKAIWIVPTAKFQRSHYEQRDWARQVVQDCSAPEQAFNNWMQRDASFARYVAREARIQNMRVLTVDGSRTLEENQAFVERYFQLISLAG